MGCWKIPFLRISGYQHSLQHEAVNRGASVLETTGMQSIRKSFSAVLKKISKKPGCAARIL